MILPSLSPRVRLAVWLGVGLLVAAGLWFLPVDVPYELEAPGRVLPAREWLLVRDADGNLETRLRNHVSGTVEALNVNRFARGEAVRLVPHPAYRPQASVAAGDTLATVYSSAAEQERTALTGALAAAAARLDLFAAGEKAAVVRAAGEELAAAQERARQQQNEVTRLQALRTRNLVAEQALEEAESRLRVRLADVAAAQARLDAVRSGERPQQLDLSRAEVAALRAEIGALHDRFDLFTITAPLGGKAVRAYSDDTLMVVRDTASQVVVMPVRWRDARRLVPGQPVAVRVPGRAAPLGGRLLQRGDDIRLVSGEQVLLVTALLDAADPSLPAGTLGRCTISFGTLSLRAYLAAVVSSWFR